MTLFNLFLFIHISTGLMAVVVGIAPIITRKGSRAHRLWGRTFVILMAILLACAWVMTALHFNTYFLALSTTATLGLFSGVRVLGRKRPSLQIQDKAKALDWAAATSALAVGLWVLILILQGQSDGPAVLSIALAFSAILMGLWDVWRFARPADWPYSQDLWRYEHLVKMLGAYSAVLSAFSGNFLNALPQPWSQLWPSILLQTLSIVWVATSILKRQ